MNQLTCTEISDGLFPNERMVRIKTTEGDTSIFVSSNEIDEKENALNVVVLEKNETHALVQIPSQGGNTIAKVALYLIK